MADFKEIDVEALDKTATKAELSPADYALYQILRQLASAIKELTGAIRSRKW